MRKELFDIYYCRISDIAETEKINNIMRKNEIDAAQSEKVKAQKHAAWVLLKRAIRHSLNKDIDGIDFTKSENGKWLCDDFYFSITHSDNLVAVGISDKPIGIDLEIIKPHKDILTQKILTDTEKKQMQSLAKEQQMEYFIKLWTLKECEFKRVGQGAFISKKIEASDHCASIKIKDKLNTYFLSFAGESIKMLKIY